jgi:hypothetical protein
MQNENSTVRLPKGFIINFQLPTILWARGVGARRWIQANPLARAMNAKVRIYFRRKYDAMHGKRVVDFRL